MTASKQHPKTTRNMALIQRPTTWTGNHNSCWLISDVLPRCSAVLVLIILLRSLDAATPAIRVARAHIDAAAVYQGTNPDLEAYADEISTLLEGRDAGTKTMSFVFGINRHADKLLSQRQSDRLSALLNRQQPRIKRLHDERNVLRGFFFAKAWELPLLKDRERQRGLEELHGWLAVWLHSTLHERIAHHHLCREVFGLLTPAQQTALADGDWDQYIRKSTGHQRAYFGDRIVSRALGKPAKPEQFQRLSDQLADDHVAIQRDLLKAERRWRILTLNQPSVSDDLLAAEWNRTAAALGAFFLNQAGHIIRLTRAGYDLADPAVRTKIEAQPATAIATLTDSVRNKLMAGAQLHANLLAAKAQDPPKPIHCDGDYRHHLQGVCIDQTGDIYWSFTTTMVKTDAHGKKLREVEVPNHHGDLCTVSNRLYVAVNLGPFNHPEGKADSWVYVYDLDLNLLAKHRTPQVIYGAGGMDFNGGSFYVIGGLPGSHERNYVYQYDKDFKFLERHDIASGQTRLGIQTAAFINDQWWFGCYGTPKITLKTDAEFNLLGKYTFDCAYGIAANPLGQILTATGPCRNGRCEGALHLSVPNKTDGLKVLR